jgi:hypothetical protein
MKTFQIKDNDISDGYHTFNELYDHRCLLFINLCLAAVNFRSAWKQDYEDWFCLYLETPKGQISYHVPNKYLHLVADKIPHNSDYAWDGHTSEDVIERLKASAV